MWLYLCAKNTIENEIAISQYLSTHQIVKILYIRPVSHVFLYYVMIFVISRHVVYRQKITENVKKSNWCWWKIQSIHIQSHIYNGVNQHRNLSRRCCNFLA